MDFFFWDDHRSHPFAAKPTRWCQFLQPLWQESKRTWKRWSYFDWIWHDSLVEYLGGHGVGNRNVPRGHDFILWGQRVVQVEPFHDMYTVYRIPTGISPHENLKHHTLEAQSLLRSILSHGWGVSFGHPKKSTFLVRKPESLVARAGSLVICSWDFLGGAHPPKRKRRNIGRPSTNYVMMIFATLEKPFHLYTSCSANSRNSIKESCGSEGHQVSFMLWRLAGLLWIKISRLYRKDFCVFACLSQWGISHVHSSSLPISNLKSSFALQLQFNFKHVFQSKLFSLLQSHQVSLRQIGEARLLDLVGLLRPDDLCLENNGLGKQNGGNVKGFATCNMPRSLDNFRL